MATDASTPILSYEQVASPAFREQYRLEMNDFVRKAPDPNKARATYVEIKLDSTLTDADRAIPTQPSPTVDVNQLKVGNDARIASGLHAVAKSVGVKITDQNAAKVRTARAEMPAQHVRQHVAKPQRPKQTSPAWARYRESQKAMAKGVDLTTYGINRANHGKVDPLPRTTQPRDNSALAQLAMLCAEFSGATKGSNVA